MNATTTTRRTARPLTVEERRQREDRAVLAVARALALIEQETHPLSYRKAMASLAVPELVSPSGYIEGEPIEPEPGTLAHAATLTDAELEEMYPIEERLY